MSKTIASAGVNISTAEVKTAGNDGRALSVFELSVSSARQLNGLIHQIAAIDGVMRVARVGMGTQQRPSRLKPADFSRQHFFIRSHR